MNEDFDQIKRCILDLKEEYRQGATTDKINPELPITERDIVSEIYYRLKIFCRGKELFSHTEIRPTSSLVTNKEYSRSTDRIDNVILKNNENRSWIQAALDIQNRYKKGEIEARFSSVPVNFFHTAIEVKIQSKFTDLKKDIIKLKYIKEQNPNCNVLFVLLNSRGKQSDHAKIIEYANSESIPIIEYTANE